MCDTEHSILSGNVTGLDLHYYDGPGYTAYFAFDKVSEAAVENASCK